MTVWNGVKTEIHEIRSTQISRDVDIISLIFNLEHLLENLKNGSIDFRVILGEACFSRGLTPSSAKYQAIFRAILQDKC
jgi:hypothetical protein